MFVYQRVGDTCCLAPYFLVVQMRLRRYGYSYSGRVVACCCRIVKTTKWDDAWIWKTACNWIATPFLFAICNGLQLQSVTKHLPATSGPFKEAKAPTSTRLTWKRPQQAARTDLWIYGFPGAVPGRKWKYQYVGTQLGPWIGEKKWAKFGKMVTWVIAANRFVIWCCMSINAYSILYVYYICIHVYVYIYMLYLYIYILYLHICIISLYPYIKCL